MAAIVTFTLTSTREVNAPKLFEDLQALFRSSGHFRKEAASALALRYGITEEVAHALLAGKARDGHKIKPRVIGNTVQFDYEGDRVLAHGDMLTPNV